MQKISENALRKALLMSATPPSFGGEGEEGAELARACAAFWIGAMRRMLGGEAVAAALKATREELIDGGRSVVRASEAMEVCRPHLQGAVVRADAVIRAALQIDAEQ